MFNKKYASNKKLVLQSDEKQKCFWCGQFLEKKNITIDHLMPRQFGGSDDISNMKICCSSCNFDRGQVTEILGMLKKTKNKKSLEKLQERAKTIELKIERWSKRHQEQRLHGLTEDIFAILNRLINSSK